MGVLLLLVLVIMLLGAQPRWGYSRDWGYRPTGVLSLALVVVVVLLITGYIPRSI
jgi:hypothetical protein